MAADARKVVAPVRRHRAAKRRKCVTARRGTQPGRVWLPARDVIPRDRMRRGGRSHVGRRRGAGLATVAAYSWVRAGRRRLWFAPEHSVAVLTT